MWTKYDADRSGSMTLSELRAMLKDLQLNLSEGELRHTLAHYDVDGSGTISRSAQALGDEAEIPLPLPQARSRRRSSSTS